MENNRFELVFNELTDAAELKNLPIDDGAMNGIIEEEEMEDEGSDNDGDEEEIAWNIIYISSWWGCLKTCPKVDRLFY